VYWYGHVAACGSGLLQHGQHSAFVALANLRYINALNNNNNNNGLNLHNMVYHETEQPRKRLEASINAEDGHSDTTNLQSDEKV